MEDILELFATMVGEILSGVRYKNPRTRTWALTVFYTVFFAVVIGLVVWSAADLLKQDSTAGAVVMSVTALVGFVAALIIIIRGHKKNWERF